VACKELKIAVSPCPNDIFTISGLLLNKVSSYFCFRFYFEDVETLNKWAIEKDFDIIKTSFGVWNKIYKKYELLPVGSALGFGIGPLLVGWKDFSPSEFTSLKIAIPGENTTAHYLFNFFYSGNIKKIFTRYDEIIPLLVKKICDLGILIHEGRFVYQKYSLKVIIDLGSFWEKKTGTPVPLGGYFVNRKLSSDIKKNIVEVLRNSLKWAKNSWQEVFPLLKKHAQELEEKIIKKHVETYVNKYTFELKNDALKSLKVFAKLTGIKDNLEKLIFRI